MPTLRQGDGPRFLNLDPGKVLSVSADAVSSGIVRTYPNSQGAESDGQVAITSGVPRSWGPFLVSTRYAVEVSAGGLDYALSDAARRALITQDAATGALVGGDGSVARVDMQDGKDGMTGPVQQMSSTASISTTTTIRLTPTGTYRTARVSWVNNGASASAKLNVAANCSNDVEGLVATQSAVQRDAQMTIGDALILVSPVPITSLNFSSDLSITSDTHRLVVTFGA